VNLSQLNRVLVQMLLLPVMALLFISGVLAWQILNAEETVRNIQQADDNIAAAAMLSTLVEDEESGVRGYQNTANEMFLQPFELAYAPLKKTAASLRAGIAAEHGDTTLVDDFNAEHRLWVFTIAQPIIDAVRAGRDTRDPSLNLHAKGAVENLRRVIGRITSAEQARKGQLIDRWQDQVRHTLEILVGSSIAVGLMIGIFSRGRLGLVMEAFSRQLAALRRNTNAVHASEQRLRAVLTSLSDGVIVSGLDGRVEMVNAAAAALTGWTEEEAIRQPLTEVFRVVDEGTREPIESPLSAVQRVLGPISLPGQGLLLRRDGVEVPIDDSGAPIRDQDGRLAGMVLIFRDITEQRRTQKTLIASEKLATAGRLAATIAHEIHNPLDAVVNLLYLMSGECSPEEHTQFLAMAQSELSRVTQISRALLGMYREARTPVTVDMREVIESVLLLVQRRYTQSGIRLEPIFEGNLSLTGYPAELRQVFINLLTNAAEASHSGNTVKVEARALQQGGTDERTPGVQVKVCDDGEGIPANVLARLFTPFFSTKGEQGTGLGLWVSKGIVDKHGGTIAVESSVEPDTHGTTFTVFLPCTEEALRAEPSPLIQHPQLV
jgi:PAS domain S-box-containing protein